MLPREIPRYLNVAYSLRFANEANEGNLAIRVCRTVHRVFLLIKELVSNKPWLCRFQAIREKLEEDFARIGSTVSENEKPLCVYFVSNFDNNGAILGKPVYYYHHYKIQDLQKHFSVVPKVVSSQTEMKTFLEEVKKRHPQKPIQFIDIVSHGAKSLLCINSSGTRQITSENLCVDFPETPQITPETLQDDLFAESAPDATILLDACLTGLGDKNIADEIARKTPGRTILAPGTSMFFSKPVIKTQNHVSKVVGAAHGFALFNAYTCKKFFYATKQPSQYPYVKDEALYSDIMPIASFPVLQNSWLDPFLDEERKDYQQKVIQIFDQLSQETKTLITKHIWKNNGSPMEPEAAFGEKFLREHPLHKNVRIAFRQVLNELIHEVREYPAVRWAKRLLLIQNLFQAICAPFRFLREKRLFQGIHKTPSSASKAYAAYDKAQGISCQGCAS
jgi:hypothetical protein